MASSLSLFLNDQVIDPEFWLSNLGFFPNTFLPLMDYRCSDRLKIIPLDVPLSEEIRDTKRLKRAISVEESLGSDVTSFANGRTTISRSSSTSSLNSLLRRQIEDHLLDFNQRVEAVEGKTIKSEDSGCSSEEDECGGGMKLFHLLVACAEAVACRDKSYASILLSDLRGQALVFGSSFQRVASCFVQGLADRLASIQPLGSVRFVSSAMNIMDFPSENKEEALGLVYEICPHIQFGHFVAISAILEAFEGENSVHIVDLGMTLGLGLGQQWLSLIDNLAIRPDLLPCRVRITGIGLDIVRFQIIGRQLEAHARKMGINLEFSVVKSNLENLQMEDIKLRKNEVLVVNSILQLHCVVKESRGALNSVLKMIHELSPKILTLVEQDSNHNGPFFLGRFMEALHYYSAIFDSLDAMLPKYDTRRAKIEQFYFAEEIKNIVSCEGPGRVERHEKVEQWRRRMSRAGFQAAPMKMVGQAKKWLESKKDFEGYTVAEDKGCLILGWKTKPIAAASCWKC